MAMTKVKNLQLWCKKMAEGYRDVEVTNMASAWKSGLAFCAIIHRFRPDLIFLNTASNHCLLLQKEQNVKGGEGPSGKEAVGINNGTRDYDSLSKENVFENNNLAFEVAEKDLSIPAFLEAEDMVAIRVPDKLSVVTYVSQYYNYFHNKPQLGGPGVNKFVTPSKRKDNKPATLSPAESKAGLTPSQKKDGNTTEIKKNRQESIGDKCSICHEKVYLMERHIENAKLYHRRCFRNSELSPQSKVFKRQPYSPIPETQESQTSKYRKLNSDTKKDTSEKYEPPKPDFLKKSTEIKSAGDENTSKSQATVSDFLAMKMGGKSKDGLPDRTSAAPKANLNTRFGAAAAPASETKPKTVDYVNKFKELDNRNLKALNDSTPSKPSEQHKLQENSNESAKQFPVPKRRQNIGKISEKMDTSETPAVRPSPVPRKQATPFSTGYTSKNDDIKSKQETKGTDYSRPKTPPNNRHSEFSLGKGKEHSPSPPPPLPVSSPPKVPASSPPKMPASSPPKMPASQPPTDHTVPPTKLNFNSSPANSPRQHRKNSPFNSPRDRNKFNKTEAKEPVRPHQAPTKPPRVVSDATERSASPMDTNEGAVLSKAVVHEPSTAQSAVLVVPKRHNPHEEQNDKQVLGGLLKSLAGVRKNKNDANTTSSSNEAKGLPSASGAFSSNKTDVKVDLKKKDDSKFDLNKTTEKVDLRSKDKNEGNKFGESHLKPRPKTSFVSQNRDMFSDTPAKTKDESQGKTKKVTTTKTVITTTTKTTDKKSKDTEKVVEKSKVTTSSGDNLTTTDNDIPEWKRKLEERKRERARPKSADLLSDKTSASSEPSSGMLDWQKEAEKRKEQRKGAYVDPEKVPRAANRNTSNFNDNNNESGQLSRPLSPPQPRPMSPPHKHSNGYTADSNRLNKSKSPERSNVDVNKPAARDSKFPGLKPVEGNKKKILFENSTVTGDKSQADVSKKKIGLGQKFVFDDVELKPAPKKPPRPADPPASPTSPKPPPSRPPPPKSSPGSVTKHHVTTYQIQRQLRLIDERLTELELKGRTLEDSIRNANDDEEDKLMINWFELINDKNDLVRKECDLVYISKQQELEIEQDKVEQQLRNLVDKPTRLRTEADEEEEQELLEKKVELVYQRNSIIDSIDEDRIRYLAEDADIEAMLESKGFLKEGRDGKMNKKKEKHMK